MQIPHTFKYKQHLIEYVHVTTPSCPASFGACTRFSFDASNLHIEDVDKNGNKRQRSSRTRKAKPSIFVTSICDVTHLCRIPLTMGTERTPTKFMYPKSKTLNLVTANLCDVTHICKTTNFPVNTDIRHGSLENACVTG